MTGFDATGPGVDGRAEREAVALGFRLLLVNAWHRRRSIAGAASVVAAPLLLLALAMSPRYVSSSTLMLLLGPEFAARAPAGSAASTSLAFDADHILGNESAILDSDDLHRAVIGAIGVSRLYPDLDEPPSVAGRIVGAVFGLPDTLARTLADAPPRPQPDAGAVRTERALERFDAHLALEPSKGASVLTLSFTHRDPAIARDVLALLERFYQADRATLYDQQQLAPLRDEVERARTAFGAAEASLAAFRARHGLSDYTTELDIALHERGDLAHDRDDAARTGAAARARADKLAAELRALPAMLPGGADSDRDGRTAPLRTNLDALRAEQATVLARFRPDSPEARDVADRLGRGARDLAAADGAAAPLSATHTVRNGDRDAVLASLLAAEADVGATAARDESDADAVAALDRRIGALDRIARELDLLSTARDAAGDTFRTLTAALTVATRDAAVEARSLPGARVASAPNLPMRPRPLRLLLIAAAVALAGAATVAATALLHVGRRVILLGDELEATGVALLAIIPRPDPFIDGDAIKPVLP